MGRAALPEAGAESLDDSGKGVEPRAIDGLPLVVVVAHPLDCLVALLVRKRHTAVRSERFEGREPLR